MREWISFRYSRRPNHGFDVAVAPGLLTDAVHEPAHAGITVEVAVHILLRLATTDTDLLGQAECRHAVHQSEIDGLGCAPLVTVDRRQFDAEHFRGGGAVHILIVAEGAQQTFVFRQVRHDAQLDL